MTDAQIFQFLGLTFFAMGIGMLTNPKFIKEIVRDFLGSTANVFYGGLFCMVIGFPLVALHNIWMLHPTVIITILGWVSLLKGLALLMFPLQAMDMYKGVIAKENKNYISYGVLALGIVLLCLGYFA